MDDHELKWRETSTSKTKRCRSCCQLPKACIGPDGNKQIEPLSCWINLIAAFMLNILFACTEIGFAIFYDHFVEQYGSTRSTIGFLFSSFKIVGALSGLFTSPFVDLYGCRPVALIGGILLGLGSSLLAIAPNLGWLFFFYGIIAGIGNACIFLSSMTIVQQSFTYNRGIATGMSSLGFTAGTIAGPAILNYFLSHYSVSGALLLYGGLFVQGIVFTMLIHTPKNLIQSNQLQTEDSEVNHPDEHKTNKKSDNGSCDLEDPVNDILLNEEHTERKPFNDSLNTNHDENTREPSQEIKPNMRLRLKVILRDMMDFSILKQVTFNLTILFYILYFFSRTAIFSQMVSAAIYRGISSKEAAYLLTINGFGNLVSRILSLVLLNLKWMNPLLYTGLGFLLLASAGFVACQARQYELFVGSAVLVGLGEGIANTIVPMVIVHILGVKKFPRGFSIMRVGTFPGILPAAPLTGFLVDRTGDYTIAFILCGVAASCAAVLCVVVFFMMKRQKKKLDGVNE